LFEATFKKLMMESAMYSLSCGPILLWLPRKNDYHMNQDRFSVLLWNDRFRFFPSRTRTITTTPIPITAHAAKR